jgi:acyl dehydratase
MSNIAAAAACLICSHMVSRPWSTPHRAPGCFPTSQSSRFLKPVYAGDTIYPALEVTELVPGRTTGVVTLRSTVFNQRKELVLEGMQKFLIRKRRT